MQPHDQIAPPASAPRHAVDYEAQKLARDWPTKKGPRTD
jgi:hypothetical protein